MAQKSPLEQLVAAGDRGLLRQWFAGHPIPVINTAVAALGEAGRDELVAAVLDTNAQAARRARLEEAMSRIIGLPDLGFFAEVFSYTTIELSGDGFYGACYHVWLSVEGFDALPDDELARLVAHETYHSFNCVNDGPVGALNEAGGFVYAMFDPGYVPGATWAEATYGTKLFYRDIMDQPVYPLEAPAHPTAKMLWVLSFISEHDTSQLPWNSQERLVYCYQTYWEHLDRDVDFWLVWLPAAEAATTAMKQDPQCTPLRPEVSVDIDPAAWLPRGTAWSEYGPSYEFSPTIVDNGATHTHAYGRAAGAFRYRFWLSTVPPRGVTITARLSSEEPGYSARPDAFSKVFLRVNGAGRGARMVIPDNGSGVNYQWTVPASALHVGRNTLVFRVPPGTAHTNGLALYFRGLAPCQKNDPIRVRSAFPLEGS